MIIPIRCFTCNQLIASKYKLYLDLVEMMEVNTDLKELKDADGGLYKIDKNKTASENAFILLQLDRYCCRRHLLSHTDLVDKI